MHDHECNHDACRMEIEALYSMYDELRERIENIERAA